MSELREKLIRAALRFGAEADDLRERVREAERILVEAGFDVPVDVPVAEGVLRWAPDRGRWRLVYHDEHGRTFPLDRAPLDAVVAGAFALDDLVGLMLEAEA